MNEQHNGSESVGVNGRLGLTPTTLHRHLLLAQSMCIYIYICIHCLRKYDKVELYRSVVVRLVVRFDVTRKACIADVKQGSAN